MHGINISALRELKCLREIQHANVIALVDAYAADGALHMVLELCIGDLNDIIRDKKILLSPSDVKRYVKMTLQGVEHMHSHFILHRDMKPENLLIGADKQIKIADFGLAVYAGTPRPLTAAVVTSWYRCPELFFGAKHYSYAIDMWSVGCIFAELIIRSPLFETTSESTIEHLKKIFNLLGTPSDETWKDAKLLPNYVEFEHRDPLDITDLLKFQQPEAKDLLLGMLSLNPLNRISAKESLKHPYFTSGVLATKHTDLNLGGRGENAVRKDPSFQCDENPSKVLKVGEK